MNPIRFIGALAATASISVVASAGPNEPAELPWSFAPLKRPEVASAKYPKWALDDLDRFIAARLEGEGLRPNGNAGRRTLIRRAALDLTGLPPTLEEIDDFLRNPSSDEAAFAKVVDHWIRSTTRST